MKNMRTCDQAQKVAPFGIAPAPGECKGLKATEPRVSLASLRTANRDALSAADEAMIALTALFSSPKKGERAAGGELAERVSRRRCLITGFNLRAR